jgi:hypothetical protein
MMSSEQAQLRDREGHQRFIELCALCCTGSLSKDELKALNTHLTSCHECRGLLADYRALSQEGIPLLANDAAFEEVKGFDRELARTKKRLLAILDGPSRAEQTGSSHPGRGWRPWAVFAVPAAQYVALIAVGTLIGVGAETLWVKKDKPARSVEVGQRQPESQMQAQLALAIRDRDALARLSAEREDVLKRASAEIESQKSEISHLKRRLDDSDKSKAVDMSTIAELSGENAVLVAERQTFAQHVANSESNLGQLKQQIEQLRADRNGWQVESATKEKRIGELLVEVADQQRLLAADRDIRELMGARDLLISDVIDIDTMGHSKKPFGRIFYTKNKSLVFYAFDLDKQPGLRKASTFQAWGARATGKGNEYPVSLGIFFMDNEAARRWRLELEDDPKLLQEIDSVFVTVEPQGGSKKPSGKQLLFSSLRGEANHP